MDDPLDRTALRQRLGAHRFRQRMNLELYHAAQIVGPGRSLFHPENLPLLRKLIRIGTKCTGTYRRGIQNARNIQVTENEFRLGKLPAAFDGLRILHLSDLHLDIDPAITDALLAVLPAVTYDLCVITGDYRAETWGPMEAALDETQRVVASLRQPVYGILGNHDFLEMLPGLEAMGIDMLVNEHRVIEREGSKLVLAGVDDPHFYETDDFEDALRGVPEGAPVVMLSHTAEPHRQALAAGVDIMLAGHTHGGQFCLPGGFALMHNARHPRWMNQGAWKYHTLQGYTSRGVGCSLVPMRFFCAPEITMHTLRRGAER